MQAHPAAPEQVLQESPAALALVHPPALALLPKHPATLLSRPRAVPNRPQMLLSLRRALPNRPPMLPRRPQTRLRHLQMLPRHPQMQRRRLVALLWCVLMSGTLSHPLALHHCLHLCPCGLYESSQHTRETQQQSFSFSVAVLTGLVTPLCYLSN